MKLHDSEQLKNNKQSRISEKRISRQSIKQSLPSFMPILEVDENQPDGMYEDNRRSFEFEETKM
jgi:hypothetical protein